MNTLNNLTERAQDDITEAFYESAKSNAATSGGLLVAYSPDFEEFPYQSISFRRDRRIVEGSPLSPIDTFSVLQVVDPRCGDMQASLKAADDNNHAIDSIHQTIDSGQDVIVGMDHLEIVDIAYLAAGNSAELRSRGAEHNSGMVLSKAASDYMGVDVGSLASDDMPYEFIEEYLSTFGIEIREDGTVPVRSFLKLAVDVQFLVIPNTGSFSELRGLQHEAVEAHNREVKKEIKGYMTRRGVKRKPPLCLYVAMPGTKNKPLDLKTYWRNLQVEGHHLTIPEHIPTNSEEVEIIGKFSDGMIDFTKLGLTYAATMRLSNDKSPLVRFDHLPTAIVDKERLLQFAGKLINLVDDVDGTTTVYDVKGNLPKKTKATE